MNFAKKGLRVTTAYRKLDVSEQTGEGRRK